MTGESVFKMPELQGIISENDPAFEVAAPEPVKKAVAQAADGANLEGLPVLPPQSSIGEEAFRRHVGYQGERHIESTGFQQEANARANRKAPPEEYVRINGEIRAKYKIEVTFTQGRTTQGPNLLGIQVWESGKHFHGGGDELAYWCRDNRQGHNEGCWGVISGDNIQGDVAYCPHCKKMMNAELLTNLRVGKVSSQNLAKEVAVIFRQLGSNADIYLKYHKSDVHYIAMERAKGPEAAARLKGMHIYPLKNILKDTAHGADLTKRFLTFLTS